MQYIFISNSHENRNVFDFAGVFDDVVELLLKHGADPGCVGFFMDYPDHFDLGYDKNATMFPLLNVTRKGATSVVNLLLNAGANVHQVNSRGQTALHGCCLSSPRTYTNEMIKILLQHKAAVNTREANGRTALHYACENNSIDEVNMLIEAGTKLNVMDYYGFTELHLAALSVKDPEEKMEKLLDSGSYLTKVIIEAYETVAWAVLKQQTDYNNKLEDTIHILCNATHMREKHNIPKTPQAPLECYGFAKEWVTMEELMMHQNSVGQLMIQTTLARERIYKTRLRIAPLQEIINLCTYVNLVCSGVYVLQDTCQLTLQPNLPRHHKH